MFVPAFDVGVVCPSAPAGVEALSGINGSTVAQTVSLDGDPAMYNNTEAPQNCVGSTSCTGPPFSGSPWTVPAPSHWYAVPSGAEGMAPAKELVAAPMPAIVLEHEAVVHGPMPKDEAEDTEERDIGPQPKPPAVLLGLCSVHASGNKGDLLKALEMVWNKPQAEDTAAASNKGIRPTPGHAVMCGNALVLGAATSLWTWGSKTVMGEACSPGDLAKEFKESASTNAEAVTPIGGHWLRHHVLKPEGGP